MGWLWSSDAPASPTPPIPEKSASTPLQSTPETSVAPTQSKPFSRDELAEQELQSFLKEIDAEVKTSSTKYNRVPRSLPSSAPATKTVQPTPSQSSDDPNEPLSSQLLPTTMSCRTAFDAAFYCNSFGGRFNDLYRYGNLRSCSETWGDFWFCMRTRTYSSPEKENAIKEHYRQKESRKYDKGLGRESSEDVWKPRERKLEWGAAFNKEFEEFEGSDEEWRDQQRRWRREHREGRVDGSMGE